MENPANRPRLAPLLDPDVSPMPARIKKVAPAGRGRYLFYGAILMVAVGAAAWRFLSWGPPPVPSTTMQNADRVREQASAPPPPATPDKPAENTGPQPKVAGRRGVPK